jgi:hypothetical protein
LVEAIIDSPLGVLVGVLKMGKPALSRAGIVPHAEPKVVSGKSFGNMIDASWPSTDALAKFFGLTTLAPHDIVICFQQRRISHCE